MNYFKHVNWKALKIVPGIGSTAILTFHTLPHIIPTETIEKRLALSSSKPGEKYEIILKDVCSKMKIDPDKIQLFYNKKLFTISGGCFYFPGKSVIGLPQNCYFSDGEEIKQAFVSLIKNDANLDSIIDKSLEDVFCLSDDQVKFLFAHELTHIKDLHFLTKTLHATGFFLISYLGGLFLAPFMHRFLYGSILVQCVVWALGFGLYCVTKRRLNHWLEYKADESAALLGYEYCLGGIMYMNNQLKLNCILKKLYGFGCEDLFSEEGDNLQTILTHPKRTDRLKRLNEIKNLF